MQVVGRMGRLICSHTSVGALLRTLEGHGASGQAVAASPDGKCVVSGSDDETVRIWNFETGVSGSLCDDVYGGCSVPPNGKGLVAGNHRVCSWNSHAGMQQKPFVL